MSRDEVRRHMGDSWWDRVAEREQDEVRNCKRCKHYIAARTEEAAPVCTAWSKVYGVVHHIGRGYSGLRNDAPFCQMFEPKP